MTEHSDPASPRGESARYADLPDEVREPLQQYEDSAAQLSTIAADLPQMQQQLDAALGGEHAPPDLRNTAHEFMRMLGARTQELCHGMYATAYLSAEHYRQECAEHNQHEQRDQEES